MPTVTTRAGTPPDTVAPEWIACRGAVRSVVEDVVVCPRGWFAPWERCLGCRYLEAAEDDRDRDCSCFSEPTITTAEDRVEPPLESWAQLVIELL